MQFIPPLLADSVGRHKWLLVGTAGASVASSSADVGVLFLLRAFLDGPVRTPGEAGLIALPLAALALYVVKGVARAVERRTSERAAQRVTLDLRRRLFDHLLRLPMAFHRTRAGGSTLLRFLGDLGAVRRLVSNGWASLLADGLAVAVLLVGAVALSPPLGGVLLALAPVGVWVVARLNPRLRLANSRARAERGRLASLVHDDVSGIAAIKVFRRESHELGRFSTHAERLAARMVEQADLAGWMEALAAVSCGAALAAVLGLAGALSAVGEVSMGTLAAVVALLHHLPGPLRRLTRANEALQGGRVQVERALSFLERETEAATGDTLPRTPLGEVALSGRAGVPRRLVGPGEIIALWSSGGSEAAHLVDCLLGFERPACGRVFLDGCDVGTLAPADLRRHVAWSAYDAPLFRGSLSKNVRWGRRGADAEEVCSALGDVAVRRLIAAHPLGLNRPLGSQGHALRADERSLVSVARSLLVSRRVVLLEEPFAGLDREAQAGLWHQLELRRPLQSTLLITSDPLLAARADRVVHLDARST